MSIDLCTDQEGELNVQEGFYEVMELPWTSLWGWMWGILQYVSGQSPGLTSFDTGTFQMKFSSIRKIRSKMILTRRSRVQLWIAWKVKIEIFESDFYENNSFSFFFFSFELKTLISIWIELRKTFPFESKKTFCINFVSTS